MPVVIKPTGIKECSLTAIESFSKRIDMIENGCWLWNGYIGEVGYGQYRLKGRTKLAHRVMWEIVTPVPDLTKQLDHLCRVRHCVNPRHLEEVDAKTNTLRSNSPTALNSRKTHCSRGHELSGYNAYIPQAKYQRVCRQCGLMWMRNYRSRKAELTNQAEGDRDE